MEWNSDSATYFSPNVQLPSHILEQNKVIDKPYDIIWQCGGYRNSNNQFNTTAHLILNDNIKSIELAELPSSQKYSIVFDNINNEHLIAIESDSKNMYQLKLNINDATTYNEWVLLPPLHQSRYSPSLCLIDNNRKLFVVGNIYHSDNDTFEIYDFQTIKWTEYETKKDTNYQQTALHSLAYDGVDDERIYKVGGVLCEDINPSLTNKASYYDLYKQKWHTLPNTLHQHVYMHCAWISNNCLYSIGDRNNKIHSCEYLDLRVMKQWENVEDAMQLNLIKPKTPCVEFNKNYLQRSDLTIEYLIAGQV